MGRRSKWKDRASSSLYYMSYFIMSCIAIVILNYQITMSTGGSNVQTCPPPRARLKKTPPYDTRTMLLVRGCL